LRGASLLLVGRDPRGADLSLSSSGVLSGTPETVPDAGPFVLELHVQDGLGRKGSQNYLFNVVPPND